MRMMVIFTLFVAASVTFAYETVVRTVATTASPLQAYRALTEDWLYLQWNDVQAASFGVAPESPWHVTYFEGVAHEGLLKVLEPGQRLEYTLFRGTFTSTIRITFEPSPGGTSLRVEHEIPVQSAIALVEAEWAGGYWEKTLAKLVTYLNTRPNSYLARPRGENQYPALLLLHDRFGLTRTMRDMADSLAMRGYVVLAVDLFKGDRTSDIAQARLFLSSVNDEESLTAVGSAWRALLADTGVNRKRIGVLGIGYGGLIALQTMTAQSSLRAAAAWYPPDVPADSLLPKIAAPLLILHANPVGIEPTPQAEAMGKRLVQQGIRAESFVIKGDDGFAEPANGAAFSAAAFTDAMRASLSFFDRRLKL